MVGVEAPVDDRPEELDHSRPHVVQEAIGLSEGLARVQSIEETLITRVGGSCSDTGADAFVRRPSLRAPFEPLPRGVGTVERNVMAVLVPCDILGLESTGGVAGHDELVVAVAPKRATA